MDFTFDFGWMIGGVVIAAAGGAIVYFHRQIADNFASGVSSYEKVKLFGIITTVVGLIIMANLHTLILTFLVKVITGNW